MDKETKICNNKNCKQPVKPLSAFSKNKSMKDGLRPECKECVKKYNDNNKDKIAKRNKKYLAKPENKKKSLKYAKEYRDKNKAKVAKYQKDYQGKNRERFAKYNKEYQDKNKEKINKQTSKYQRNRRKTDINFRITNNLRRRIGQALKINSKSKRTIELLGCSIEQLKQHLEEQFVEGMNWDNYGGGWNGKKEWVIDHIKPCVLFDLSKPEEQLKCFNYTNLQPMWAEDNLRKSDKYE